MDARLLLVSLIGVGCVAITKAVGVNLDSFGALLDGGHAAGGEDEDAVGRTHHTRHHSTEHRHQNGSPLSSSSGEIRLVSALLRRYQEQPGSYLTRPVLNSSHLVRVNFSLVLVQILDFNEMDQKIKTLTWKKYAWRDETLVWDPAMYEGVDMIVLPPDKIWVPDIVLHNNVGSSSVETEQKNVMLSVRSDGTVFWSPPVRYDSSCSVDMTEYPFDSQECDMRFGSWSYDATKIDLVFADNKDYLELHQYIPSSEWDLMANKGERRSITYPCCPNPYLDLTYTLQLKRKVTFHMRLFLVPTPILSVLSLAIFWIPPNRPDRTAFGLALFSSFFLLLILVVNSTPPTSRASIGQFYLAILKIVFLTIVLSVSSINCIHTTRKMPVWIDKVFIRRLSFLVCSSSCHPHKKDILMPNSPNTNVNAKKWRTLALILDRIYFILFLPLLICAFVFLFPQPKLMFAMLNE